MCKVYFDGGSTVNIIICFFHKRRQSVVPSRRSSLDPAEEGLTVCLGKNMVKASQWKQREMGEVNMCSSFRVSWGIGILILSW